MTINDETIQPVQPVIVKGQLPDADCTMATPTSTVESVLPVVEVTQARAFNRDNRPGNKSGTGGLDSLGGGRLP